MKTTCGVGFPLVRRDDDDDLEQKFISDEDVYEEIAMIPNTCAAGTLYVCLASSRECWASRSGTQGQRLRCLAAVRVFLGDGNTCWTPCFVGNRRLNSWQESEASDSIFNVCVLYKQCPRDISMRYLHYARVHTRVPSGKVRQVSRYLQICIQRFAVPRQRHCTRAPSLNSVPCIIEKQPSCARSM